MIFKWVLSDDFNLMLHDIKLLGIRIEDNQEWNLHLKTVVSSLNQRLFVLRRIANQLPKEKMIPVVHSLWISKLRYGLQLCTRVRLTNSDATTATMKTLQLTQNRMLRLINNSKIKDMISTASMLNKFKLLSVNQLSAQIKLLEVWKSLNQEGYPIKLEPYNEAPASAGLNLRQKSNRIFNDSARLQIAKSSFNFDAARIWNATPMSLRRASTKAEAKRLIRIFVTSLPV